MAKFNSKIRFLLNNLVIIVCIMLSTSSFAVIHSDKTYRIFDDVVLDPTTKFYYYAKPKITVKVTYPKILSDVEDGNIDQLNQLIDDLITEERKNFRKAATEIIENPDNPASMDDRSNLNIDFNASVVNGDGSPTLSIRFSIQGFIPGMTHPRHYHRTITYDIYNGHQLALADLFEPDSDYLNLFAENAEASLSRHLDYKKMIHQGVEPIEDNYKNWNITPYGFLITFDSAQVAPRVYGTQSVLIPYKKVKTAFYPDSPVTACLKHRPHCLRNGVYTLGFREEA